MLGVGARGEVVAAAAEEEEEEAVVCVGAAAVALWAWIRAEQRGSTSSAPTNY